MRRTLAVLTGLALLAGTFAAGTGTTALAAGPHLKLAVPGAPPDGDLACTVAKTKKKKGKKRKAAATACFESFGDKVWVRDELRDGHSAIAKWKVLDVAGERVGYCRNKLGFPHWGVCNEDFLEHALFEWWAARWEATGKKFLGPWSPGMSGPVRNGP